MTHTHTESTIGWGFGQIGSHLSVEHDMTIPMAWTVGQMHEAHLKAHQTEVPQEEPVPAMPADRIEKEAEAAFLTAFPGGDWNDLGQESRDRWRDEVRERYDEKVPLLPAEDAEDAEQWERDRSILVDRMICAMAGFDFDRQWAADGGIGPDGRGAMRKAYRAQADMLLTWLERGGVTFLPSWTAMAEELAEARRDRAETGAAFDRMNDQRTRTEAELQERLAMTQTASTNLQQQVRALQERRDEALERLGEVAGERDRAVEAGRILEAQRDDLLRDVTALRVSHDEMIALEVACEKRGGYPRGLVGDTLNNLQSRAEAAEQALEERDILRGQLIHMAAERDGLARKLHKRTQVLDEGRSRLREIVSEMKFDHLSEIPPNVPMLIDALEDLAGGTVSTAPPIGMRCTEAHLGRATTGEMLEELTTRIDLGHCGLDYRTVDGD